jgi:capsular polysaccharide biosynthesis protein
MDNASGNFVAVDNNFKVIRECFLKNGGIPEVYINELYKEEEDTFHIDKGFLCYTSHWSRNFQHLLFELLPKMITYKRNFQELANVPLLLPPLLQNTLVMDLLDLLEIPREQVNSLESGSSYHVDNLFYSDYDTQPGLHRKRFKYPLDCLKIINKKCRSLAVSCEPSKKLIYISRTEEPCPEFNNSQSGGRGSRGGNGRILSNEEAMLESLKDYSIHPLFMGRTSVKEKVPLLRSVETLIIPSGAGVMNIVFADNLKKLIILASGLGQVYLDFFERLCNHLHPQCKFMVIQCTTGAFLHSPFTVNPNLVMEALSDDK